MVAAAVVMVVSFHSGFVWSLVGLGFPRLDDILYHAGLGWALFNMSISSSSLFLFALAMFLPGGVCGLSFAVDIFILGLLLCKRKYVRLPVLLGLELHA